MRKWWRRPVDDKPRVRCLVASQLPNGKIRGEALIVSLETAEWLKREWGWAVIGPDPEDMIALAIWEREREFSS